MKFLAKFFGRGKPAFRPEVADRDTTDVSRALSPKKVDAIMRAANGGDTRDQCRLAAELLEHNADIAQAVSTRINAVLGIHWSLEPGDDTPAAQNAAETLAAELSAIRGGDGVDTFDEMIEDLMGALLPGFAVSEILWKDGAHIAGFHGIEQKHFTLTETYEPLLVTGDCPRGLKLPRTAVICHRFRFHGNDPARGGLIRPLAWLHCFANGTEKNLLSFMERYGMPFMVVRVDEKTWQTERNNIKALIRNFGPNGGGIFTKGTEQELLQAANSDGNIYFRIQERLANAVNQLILGQTASSGDSAGLSGGDAQSRVRQDILESDCRRLQRTINAQLCLPWCRFNFGASVAAPRFVLDCAAPEDKLATAQMLQALAGAGLEADPEEMSERFGIRLTRRTAPEPTGAPFGMSDRSAPTAKKPQNAPNLSEALQKWLGPEAEAIRDLAEADGLSDDEFGNRLLDLASEFHGDSATMENLDEKNMTSAWRGAKNGGR